MEDINKLKKELIKSYKTQVSQIEEIKLYDRSECEFLSVKDYVYKHEKLLEEFIKKHMNLQHLNYDSLDKTINRLIDSYQGASCYWEIKDRIRAKQSKIGNSNTEKYLLGVYDIMMDTYCDLANSWERLVMGHTTEEKYGFFRKSVRSMRYAFEEDILELKSYKSLERKHDKEIKIIKERIEELELSMEE